MLKSPTVFDRVGFVFLPSRREHQVPSLSQTQKRQLVAVRDPEEPESLVVEGHDYGISVPDCPTTAHAKAARSRASRGRP
jgi:hypothetical protein